MNTPEPEDWKRVEALLDRVLDHPVEVRAAVLAELCSGDEALRARVEEMLKAGEEAASFLGDDYRERLLNELKAASDEREEDSDWCGKTIGSYRLLHRIGRGGMGQVYRAVREDEAFQQYVAVKVIRQGMETAEVQLRFRMERQILATLNHPNIARLLDGGVTEDGISYLVMSYIEGVPITTFCNQESLAVEERLELFQKVCLAVQYAHRNLIVHRDLKPSNILVTSEGIVKLLDFGIAKLLDPDMLGYTIPKTRPELRVMTPEYASPEQVLGEPVTTASDVYALGVLLYELLAGHHPYPLSSLSRGELEHLICEVEPAPPSNAIGRSEGGKREHSRLSLEALSQRRGVPHERLRRYLEGDLDNIVMMALRKEKERRYQSVEALQEDIRRFLAGLPVSARSATLGYRIRKFIGRHQAGVVAAVALVGLLITVAMISIRFAVVTSKQARQIEYESEKARQVKQFLVKIFEDVDPMRAQGREMSARELLARGTIHIDGQLMNQPEVRAEMLHVMGVVYRKLGLFGEAYRQLERALEIRRSEYGDEHLEVANTLFELGWLVDDMGAYGEAEQLHREALAIRKKLLPPNHPDIAASLNDLGVALDQKGNDFEAEELYREALEIRRRLYSDDHEFVGETMHNLAWILREKGSYSESEELQNKALKILNKKLSAGDPSITIAMLSLSKIYLEIGDYVQAESTLREALIIRKKYFDNEHPFVASGEVWLGQALHMTGKIQEAEKLLREGIKKHKVRLGDYHPFVGEDLYLLGSLLRDKGEYEESESLLLKSIDIFQKSIERENLIEGEYQFMPNAKLELGKLYLSMGRSGEAEELLLESLEYYRSRNQKKMEAWTLEVLSQLYKD